MSDSIITVDRISKRYRLGQIGMSSLRESAERLFRAKEAQPEINDFWALRDVSFEVKRGEVLGVIGRNGAGKSTLLKLLSRITEPTSGRAILRGRVASLLEVGTGFHPELTGRENIFLNGAILGMRKAEITAKFDEIVAFAELDKFIDTPVKRYSSGMYVRLAFAVAAHLDPEILLIDEVLAVGDASFQKKCLGKMSDVAKAGRTVLFVSHNMIAVNSLCQRALMLEGGRLVLDDTAQSVVIAYQTAGAQHLDIPEWADPDQAPGTADLRFKRIRVMPDGNPEGDLLDMQTPLRVETDFWVMRPGVELHLNYHLINDQGQIVLATGSNAEKRPVGCYRYSFILPAHLLNSGDYSLLIKVIRDKSHPDYINECIARFSVVDRLARGSPWMGREPGVIHPILKFSEERLSNAKDLNPEELCESFPAFERR
jgi:lipopolysaccharide transport system ATP-binding protein